MSKRRYHRRSKNEAPGGQKWKPKWFQNGSKMAPTWLQNGSWRPLGGPWARPCCQTLPGAVPERLWHGPGRPKKFMLAALERPWSEKWIDFILLQGPREGPGGGLGGHLGSFLAVGPAGTKKKQKSHKKVCLFEAVFACVFLPLPCVFCSPRHSPARKHNLKTCLKPLVFMI